MSQEEQEQQQKIWDPKFFQTQNFLGLRIFLAPTFFLDQKLFQTQNLFPTNIFSNQIFFWSYIFFRTKIIFWLKTIFGLIFFRLKMMFCGRKQSFWTLSFLKWQRAKVLLKLEFDTEDQVLFYMII